jgi:hypothetical protein
MTDVLSPLIKKFLPFAQKRMGFSKPPKLFLKNDSENANNPLGKTAYYDPSEKSVTLYVTGRHPKDVMRSLSHELVHHTQNCRGEFDDTGEMGEGYAQNDEHLREMEREAYEVGNMCFRDWEDSIKQTIYFEHLQKGEKKMSTKDWKNKELSTLLSEAWGFKFNSLQEFDEFNAAEGAEVQQEAEEDTVEESEDAEQVTEETIEEDAEEVVEEAEETVEESEETVEEAVEETVEETVEESVEESDEVVEEGVFSPNHYCVHHGGVSRNGSVEMAEAIGHNFDEELGKVTHYDMKFEDGTIMEGVPFEDIQVTNASLAEGHGHPVGKRDDDEEEDLEETTDNSDTLKEAIKALLVKHLRD